MRFPRRPLAAAAVTVTVLGLSACGSDSERMLSPRTVETSSGAAGSSPGATARIPMDAGFSDAALGDRFKVTAVVRDFPDSSPAAVVERGGEWVLVQVEVRAGTKYDGRAAGVFTLMDGPSETVGRASSLIDDAAVRAGYPPFEEAEAGQERSGWIVFQVGSRRDTYTLVYNRPPVSITGGGSVPSLTTRVELPEP